MKPAATALLLVAVALAGCTNEPADFSKQSLTVSFLDKGGGFQVILPLWLSPGTSADDWLAAFGAPPGATLSIASTERGIGLQVNGTDNVRLDAQDLVGADDAEAFTRGLFSLGDQDGRAWMQVLEGDVDISQYHYEGHSKDCFVTVTQFWSDVQDGWHQADSHSRRSDPHFDCI